MPVRRDKNCGLQLPLRLPAFPHAKNFSGRTGLEAPGKAEFELLMTELKTGMAAYPHRTVPMGAVDALPVGLSLIGPRWSAADVLAAGCAYEQASRMRVAPTYRAGIEP